MSRKTKIDESVKNEWASVKLWTINLGFSPFKPDKEGWTRHPLIILQHGSSASGHVSLDWAGAAQSILTSRIPQQTFRSVIVIDLSLLLPEEDKYSKCMDEEGVSSSLDKRVSKPIYRILNKLLLVQATIVAAGSTCQLLLKLLAMKAESGPGYLFTKENIQRAVFIHPHFPPACVNKHMTALNSELATSLIADVVFQTEEAMTRRLSMLRHVFSKGNCLINQFDTPTCLVQLLVGGSEFPRETTSAFRPDFSTLSGETLWFGELSIEMSKYSKQYEQHLKDITQEIADFWAEQEGYETASESNSGDPFRKVEASQTQFGALVLRGSRCVLMRSMTKEWTGMRIPATICRNGESAIDTAIRSMTELCDIDRDEFELIPAIPPAVIYRNQSAFDVHNMTQPDQHVGTITVYVMYATHPPPEGPLEDQDMEDEEDSLYDWYTFPRAVSRLLETGDEATVMMLQTMAYNLSAAAAHGRLPSMWGGVFGQELTGYSDSFPFRQVSLYQDGARIESLPSIVDSSVAKIQSDGGSQGLLLDSLLKKGDDSTPREPLPVTLLSGFLGAGKTTLLQELLTNDLGLKIALIINDMADVNIDAILVQRGADSIVRREEKVVELHNGCICCTLREDLLVEISSLAAENRFDYLIIESSGISEPLPVAETFTFTDEAGVSLSSVARLDTLVTVVDASTFNDEIETMDTLKRRGWQADGSDSRSVAELLCEQIEFANVVVLNKCDVIDEEDQEKVEILLRKLNPEAIIVRSCFGKIDPWAVLNTKRFTIAGAEKSPMWLKEARVGEHKTESDEFGIRSFTFRCVRPFHPARLFQAAQMMESRSGGALSSVVRLKGFAWIATHPEQQAILAFAGRSFKLTPGAPWWAAIERSMWPEGLAEAILPLWHEPFGDRQNEVVVIGKSMDIEAVKGFFLSCTLTDDEYMQGQTYWDSFTDPFEQAWIVEDQSNDYLHSHDHDHEIGSTCVADHEHGHHHHG